MPRSQILNYRIHGRLHCDPSVRNGLRQHVIQNSFWHHEIECTWGWGRPKRPQMEKYAAPQHTSHARFTAVRNGDTLMCVFCSHHPMCWAGPDTGCEGSEPERSLLHWLIVKAWLPCSRSPILNSRSPERLCQQTLEVGPLVFGRYAFVFGCFSREPILLLGAFHTFHPTLLLIGGKVFYSCDQIS